MANLPRRIIKVFLTTDFYDPHASWGMLHTSTAPSPMRYIIIGKTSVIYTGTSTALYFYEEFTQAPNKPFRNTKICN
jgi:hypothetical protein